MKQPRRQEVPWSENLAGAQGLRLKKLDTQQGTKKLPTKRGKLHEREEREGVVFVFAIGSCGRRKGEKSCLGFIIID